MGRGKGINLSFWLPLINMLPTYSQAVGEGPFLDRRGNPLPFFPSRAILGSP